jgi:Skp family chaperone for outer membrane proteins
MSLACGHATVKTRIVFVNWKAVILTALATVSAQAQSPKICLINLEQAMVSTADGQNAEKRLNAEFGPRKAALEVKQKEATALQEKIDKGGMSEEDRQKLVDQLDDKANEIDRETTQADADLQLAQRLVLKELAPKMINFVVHYIHQKGYDMVFDVSATDLPRLYQENATDITDDVVTQYDRAAGVKPAAPPAKKK